MRNKPSSLAFSHPKTLRALITGANGFVAQHTIHEFINHGYDVHGLDHTEDMFHHGTFHQVDLCDAKAVRSLIENIKPDVCIHLGGIAFVPMGWKDPRLVYDVNLLGTVNLLEGFRHHHPDARVVVVTSGEIYGRKSEKHPLKENAPMFPANPYAISKMAADQHALLYAEHFNMNIMTARPDNHTGPGQSDLFVTAAFARQLAEIADHKVDPVMAVGNLDNMRNFTDVRDVATAYRLLVETGYAGQAYNIASGEVVRIRSVLDMLCDIAGVRPEINIDPARFRPTDYLPVLDTQHLRDDTGWTPKIPLSQTLQDIYDYFRQQNH